MSRYSIAGVSTGAKPKRSKTDDEGLQEIVPREELRRKQVAGAVEETGLDGGMNPVDVGEWNRSGNPTKGGILAISGGVRRLDANFRHALMIRAASGPGFTPPKPLEE